jgi:hypothetical protein
MTLDESKDNRALEKMPGEVKNGFLDATPTPSHPPRKTTISKETVMDLIILFTDRDLPRF